MKPAILYPCRIEKDEYIAKTWMLRTTNRRAEKQKKHSRIFARQTTMKRSPNQQILDQLEGDLNKWKASEIAPKNYRDDIVKDIKRFQ